MSRQRLDARKDAAEYASEKASRMRCIKPGDPAATMRPSQITSNSARVNISGRLADGRRTSAPLSSAFPTSRNSPSRSDAIPGSRMPVSRFQSAVRERAPTPN